MIARLMSGLFATGGAAILSQFPAFLGQYRQQLAGRLAQVREDLSTLLSEAAARDLTPRQFLERAAAEGGDFSRALIADAREALSALERLEAASAAFAQAAPITLPVALARHLEIDIAESTLAHFVPAVPLTLEGLAYAGIGLLVGLLLLAGCEALGRGCLAAGRQLIRGRGDAAGQASL